jgi:hypothetical protein
MRMRHDIHEIIKVINAMHDKAVLLTRMYDFPEPDRDKVLMRNLIDDIKAMARQITYEDSSEQD